MLTLKANLQSSQGHKMELIKEIDETMLDRKTLIYKVEKNATTPSRSELQLDVATMQKVDPKLVIITEINTEYGTNTTEITAQVYANETAYKALVSESMAKKSEVKTPEPVVEEPKVEEAPAAEGTEEKTE